jgi:hypothetical protein
VLLAVGLTAGAGAGQHAASRLIPEHGGTESVTGLGFSDLPALDAAPRGREQLDRESETRRVDVLGIVDGVGLLLLLAWWVVLHHHRTRQISFRRADARPRARPALPALVRSS